MSAEKPPPREFPLLATPVRDLGLRIEGTALEPIVQSFMKELDRAGIRQLRPHFYLSLEWGVPFDSISIAIPFYLASPELTALQRQRGGHVEGASRADILSYLRHEMGHVVNYAYKLYEDEVWIKHFGSITQPYLDDYRPEPFCRRYVRHLPGWYAQKHPDEDWAETFAVWLTPRLNWHKEYAEAPEALAKLEYCQRTIADLAEKSPLITAHDADEDVASVGASLEELYGKDAPEKSAFPPGIDGALRAIFEDWGSFEDASSTADRRPAADLLHRIEPDVLAHVYRWTGHFPEHTQVLLRHLAERAAELRQVYPEDQEAEAIIAVTTLVTALAMNHVHRGSYLP